MSFPFFKQPDSRDCGATCLKMVAKYYGRSISLQKLRVLSETTRQGASLKYIADAAEKIGFRTIGVKLSFKELMEDAPLPCIVFWNQKHYVVVYSKKYKKGKYIISVADPAHGLIKYNQEDFLKSWMGNGNEAEAKLGIVLLLEPSPRLKEIEPDDQETKQGFSFLFKYLVPYRKSLIQLAIGLLAGSILQLIFPFLTQSIVDVGIQNQDINFVYLILMAQLFLFLGRISIEFIRGWILLHLSTRINISLISNFFIKLMNLPISFFDTRMTGDIMQRIRDHQKIQNLLTTSSMNVLFSLFNLAVFGAILIWYNYYIFIVFFIGSLLYMTWIILFLKRRRALDFKRFNELSKEQSKVMEIINGMQEIKLFNAEKNKRWGWEYIQANLFKIQIKRLTLSQSQNLGSNFINEIKNIFITVLSAKLVIEGKITLGMMLSISYIIGQLNSPIQQLIGFIHSVQDAGIALERLSEIHNKKDEESMNDTIIRNITTNQPLKLKNVSFRYTSSIEQVLTDINMTIPENKITAIVGVSGSGKTTLLKLLLQYYEPIAGEIFQGNVHLNSISSQVWRNHIGVVMQDGFIFNDTIANNIAIGEESIDKELLRNAVELANIREYIENLPLGYNTMIGAEGVGISGGQKQRLFIARAIYKNPSYIFLDEATSSLDANNEKIIMKNLDQFFKNKTVVIIAHRLSTVKNADQIVVLDQGSIVEKGSHNELVKKKGHYLNLVKNQLELGT